MISASESLLAQRAAVFGSNAGSIGPPQLVDDIFLENAHTSAAVVNAKTVSQHLQTVPHLWILSLGRQAAGLSILLIFFKVIACKINTICGQKHSNSRCKSNLRIVLNIHAQGTKEAMRMEKKEQEKKTGKKKSNKSKASDRAF